MNPTNGPPKPAPVPVWKTVRLRELPDKWAWNVAVAVNADGSAKRVDTLEIVAGTLLNIMDAVQAIQNRPTGTYALLDELQTVRRLLSPVTPAKSDRTKREAESRARAWAAYVKAGGRMEPDGDAEGAPLNTFNFSVRVRNALRREGCTTVADLTRRTGDDLLEMRNFGTCSLEEVREKLAEHGLKLAGD